MAELKNPCIINECGLRDEHKGNPTCRDCEKRVAYVAALGGLSESVPLGVSLDGGGGSGLLIDDCRLVIDEEREDEVEEQAGYGEKPAETKICSREGCEYAGQPQPLDDFDRASKSKGGRQAHCKDCRRRIQRKLREKKKGANKAPPVSKGVAKPATKTAGKPEQDVSTPPDDYTLTVDFASHPEVLKKIEDIARDKIRTPATQVLYWLKEFSLIKDAAV